MAEPLISNRILFRKKGTQRDFIITTKSILNVTHLELSKKLGISERTLTSWTTEKLNMSHKSAVFLADLANIPLPKNVTVVSWTDHLRKISSLGGTKRIAIHGKIATDESYRKNKWRQWWEETGQYQKKAPGFQDIIKIKIPRKSALLAEFVGIMLGDGGIAPYHLSITLSNTETDYAKYITRIAHQLFEVHAKIYKKKSAQAITIIIQRKELVDFCKKIGLVQGNKVHKQVDIPNWIKENNGFSIACVRGLIDTDGCFYTNSYSVNRKKYSYSKICFTNFSLPLITSVAEVLKRSGIETSISKNSKDLRITSKECVTKYITLFGSNNKKHLAKIKNFNKNDPQ